MYIIGSFGCFESIWIIDSSGLLILLSTFVVVVIIFLLKELIENNFGWSALFCSSTSLARNNESEHVLQHAFLLF